VVFTAGATSELYRNVYWAADVILDLLRFILVIAMTHAVLEGEALRPAIGRLLGMIVTVAIVLPFVLFHPLFSTRWFLHTSQLLSFGGAAMNLFLWTAIIGKRQRDTQLLLVSAGLGVAVTGVATTYGLLQFTSTELRWLPDIFKSMTLLLGVLLWCWAFRPATRTGLAARSVPTAGRSTAT